MKDKIAQLAIRLGDDHLVLGHRVSEWCGHAPVLEEDLAMPNIGLDLIGQARALYTYAGELEGRGRSEDDIAYLRVEKDYHNCLLVERPNGDFAETMLKVLYFAAFMEPYWQAMTSSSDETLAAVAAKAVKETAYHVRHAGEWVIRLGDGTEESAVRMQAAVEQLHPYTAELFEQDDLTDALAEAGISPDPAAMRAAWENTIATIFAEARLTMPEVQFPYSGGRKGVHDEAMGYLLADLQYMQRTFPGATW